MADAKRLEIGRVIKPVHIVLRSFYMVNMK